MLNQTGEFIQKLIQGTIDKKYSWNKMVGYPQEIEQGMSRNELVLIRISESYYFRDKSNFIALLRSQPNKYSIFIYSYRSLEFSNIVIDAQAYFRIRTVIQNQLDVKENLLDEFLNS